ncbi:MAG: EAL domain-containing protein [Pseudomonadales bacterium]
MLQLNFEHFQDKQQQRLSTLLNTSTLQVTSAVLSNDSDLSKNLVSRLLENKFIDHVSIYSNTTLLAEGQQQSSDSGINFPTSLFMAAFKEHKVVLGKPAFGETSTVTLRLNNHLVYMPFYQQALQQLLVFGGVFLGFILWLRLIVKTRLQQPTKSLQTQLQQTQQQLASSQDTLAKIKRIETIGDWHYDIEKSALTWGGELASILGITSESINSIDSILGHVSADHHEKLAISIATACQTQQPLDIEIAINQNLHKQRWVHATGRCQLVNNEPMWVEGFLHDITATHTSQTNLQLTDFALNQAPDSIFTIDAQGTIISVNDTACLSFGYSREEMIGQTVGLLNRKFNMSDWPRWWQTVKAQKQHTSFADNQTKSGHLFPVEIAYSYFSYDQQELCILLVKDITERKKHEDVIQHLAYHDALTDLPNRRLLLDRLDQALTSARRYEHAGAMLFIDLDNFKKINDTLGHSVGDAVLKELANRIASHLRKSDTVARIGGDEFVVLLPVVNNGSSNLEHCVTDLANKIMLLISRPLIIEENKLQITASIGAVTFPDNLNNNADELICFADTAMYRAKENGRNGVVLFNRGMAESKSRQLKLEKQLQSAFENDEFQLYFQPQYNSQQQLIGAETLLRWKTSSGMVSPAEFIPIMESNGSILTIGEWVMRQACQQLKLWLNDGLWNDSLTLAINISPKEFEQPHFVQQVAAIIAETRVPAHCIDIEITEGTLINNIEQIIETLRQLRALGVKVSIDDFGTGYSSLTYLKRLPIDTVKIDQSFIKDVPADDSAGAIINTIISMAKQLNLEVIAEGVETIEQFHYLENNDCKKFQGFYFNRPMGNLDFSLLLADNKPMALTKLS